MEGLCRREWWPFHSTVLGLIQKLVSLPSKCWYLQDYMVSQGKVLEWDLFRSLGEKMKSSAHWGLLRGSNLIYCLEYTNL